LWRMTQALRQDTRSDPQPDDWVPDAPPSHRPNGTPQQARPLRRWCWLLVAVTVGTAGLAANKLSDALHPPTPPLVSGPVARTSVTALGWLEPASSVVKVAAPATVEASRIAELRVIDGDTVVAGQVIAVLDTAAKIEAQVQASLAQIELKRALLQRVTLDTQNSVVAKRMAIARARADVEQADAEVARQRTLVAREFATPANLEKRKRDLAVAQAQIQEAEAALKRLDATLPAYGQRSVQIDVAVAERELAVAEADLAQLRVSLDQASIRSPVQGVVISVLSRAGEKISQDGVAEIGSTNAMVAIGEVYQSDIVLIRVGQRVEVKADLLKEPVIGHVERIGLKVKRQSIINNDPATDTDARVIEVRVRLEPEASARVAALTRLQVRLHFALERATSGGTDPTVAEAR
jgi:HlyD family secretion protein